MEIILNRKHRKPTHTIGKFYIDGVAWKDSLEDPDRGLDNQMTESEIRSKKVSANTAIPTGRYEVGLTFSPKFKRDLPIIKNVKGFEAIRIHAGNDTGDTEGCLKRRLPKIARYHRGENSKTHPPIRSRRCLPTVHRHRLLATPLSPRFRWHQCQARDCCSSCSGSRSDQAARRPQS